MGANDVQIQIIGKDLASTAFKQVNNSAQETAQAMESFGASVGLVNSTLSNATGYALAIAGINGLRDAFDSTLGAAEDFYKTMETGSISMAGTLMSMGLLNGEAISWGSALSMSKDLMAQLNDQAILTGSSTKEISDVFRAMLPAALNAKMTIGQTLELASTLTTTGKAMGLQENILMRDVADIITGKNAQRTKLGSLLGISDADIAAAKQSAGGLYAFLTERLRGEKEANENYLTSLEGRINHLKEAVGRIGGTGLSPIFSAATDELAVLADKFVTVDNETKKVTVNQDLVNEIASASRTAIVFGGEIKKIGSDLSVVAVPAAKILGTALKVVAENAELVTVGIAGWVVMGKINAMITDVSAVTNGAAKAQTFLGQAVLDTQTKYAKQIVVAEEAATAERAAAVAAAEQQVKATLAGTTMETAAVAASLGQTELAAAIQKSVLAENEQMAAAVRKAEVIEAANAAIIAGQLELAEAIMATNLTIEEQAIASEVMAERMVVASALAKGGQLELAQSILAATLALDEEGIAATVTGEKIAVGAASSAVAQEALTGSVATTTAAHIESGIAAEGAGTKTVSAMAVAGTAVGNLGKTVLALAGGWLGVAAAIGYATYKLVEYNNAKNDYKGYNEDARTRVNPETGKRQKMAYIEGKTDTLFDPTTGGTVEVKASDGAWGWKDLSDAENEHQDAVDAQKKKRDEEEERRLFGMPDPNAPSLDDITNKYDPEANEKKKKTKKEKYEIADEAGEYSDMIKQAADAAGVDRNLFAAVVKAESSFNPNAVSGAGAIGFTQLMPETAAGLGVDPNDPQQNLQGGAKYLRQQMDTFGGNVRMAVAAYNAGPQAVKDYGGVPPYTETQNYVNKIVGYLDAAGHGSEDKPGDYYKKQQETKKKADELLKQLDSKLNSLKMLPTRETEEQKTNNEVIGMQSQSAQLATSGVDVTQINAKIEQYKKLSTDKIMKNWREAWQSVKDDTVNFHAQLTDDASTQAELEYQKTVQKINKETDEKKRAIMVDENDKQAAAAVDEQRNEQILVAQKTRNQKQRDAMMEFYQHEVDLNGYELNLGKMTASEVDALNLEVYNAEITRLQGLLDKQKLTYTERVKLEGQLSDVAQKRNGVLSNSFDTGASVAIEELKKQTTDFKSIYMGAWSSMDSSTKTHIENILTMNEGLGTGIKETILGISEAVVKMFADILYQTYIMQPLKNWFTGILGNVSGGGTTTDSGGSGVAYSLLGNMFGGTSSSSTSSSSFDIMNGGGSFNLPALAGGGLGSGWTIVGEKGPELVNFSNPGRVYNAKDTSAALSGATAGSRSGSPIIMNIKTNDANSFKQSRGQILGSMGAAVRMAERNM